MVLPWKAVTPPQSSLVLPAVVGGWVVAAAESAVVSVVGPAMGHMAPPLGALASAPAVVVVVVVVA